MGKESRVWTIIYWYLQGNKVLSGLKLPILYGTRYRKTGAKIFSLRPRFHMWNTVKAISSSYEHMVAHRLSHDYRYIHTKLPVHLPNVFRGFFVLMDAYLDPTSTRGGIKVLRFYVSSVTSSGPVETPEWPTKLKSGSQYRPKFLALALTQGFHRKRKLICILVKCMALWDEQRMDNAIFMQSINIL